MKFDFSYVDNFLDALEGKCSFNTLKNTLGYKAIQNHASLTNNTFSIDMIEKAVQGEFNAGYGLVRLSKNLIRIKDMVSKLKNCTDEWQDIINQNIQNIFLDCDLAQLTICPVIGYDVGIGVEDIVCINLNFDLCLNDIREIFSISIHETCHTLSEKVFPVDFNINTKENFIQTITSLILYEGLGIFSAYFYREENNMKKNGYVTIEDYNLDKIDKDKLMLLYNNLVTALKDEKISLNEMMDIAFSTNRLTHRLGYSIINYAYKNYGINEVRNLAKSSPNYFKEKYLLNLSL